MPIASRTHTRSRRPPRPSILDVWGRGRDGAGGWTRPEKPEESSGASRPSAGPQPTAMRAGHGARRGRGRAARDRPGGRGGGWGADTHLPRPGRPTPAAAEEDATGAAGAGTAEDEDDAAEAGAAPGDESRPPPGLRPLAGAGGCGFSDMVSGPYTGSHAGRGQPGAGRAEETPERGGDARTPRGQARAGAGWRGRGSQGKEDNDEGAGRPADTEQPPGAGPGRAVAVATKTV